MSSCVDSSGPNTHLIRRSASWEEVAVVIAMNGHVEDAGVVVKRLLGAVAMVNILRGDSAHVIAARFFKRVLCKVKQEAGPE